MMPPVPGARATHGLERRLGPFDAASIVVSNVIGSGIFITPIIVAHLVPHPAAVLGVWLAGGLLAFVGAMAYAELASIRPRAGGEYVYLREAFGPLIAFLSGWTSFVAGFSGAIAAGAVGLTTYVGRFVPAAADARPFFTLTLPLVSLSFSPASLLALVVIGSLSLIHIRGLGPGRLVQNTLTAIKITGLVAFLALGFSLGRGSMTHFQTGGDLAPVNWLLALIPVMFSYSGWNAASYVAEEIRMPERNIPRALGLGTGAVVLIYLALNALYLYAMPATEMATLKGGVLDASAERLFGFVAARLLAAFTAVSIAASISAMVLAGPRVYFAMARDGLFLRAVSSVHPRFRTPAVAIAAQSIWSGVLVLSGSLAQLVSYTGFAVVMFAGIAVLALFVFRTKEPAEQRPFKTWGYPIAPAVFVVASGAMLVSEIWRSPATAGAGVLVIAAGIPIYFVFRRAERQGRSSRRSPR